MKTPQAMAACVALAMGAHAVLLMQHPPGLGHVAVPAGSAVSVRLQAADVPAMQAAPEAQQATATTSGDVPHADEAALAQTKTAEEAAPAFEGGTPGIGLPDAPLPDGGADVRAYLVLDEHGVAQSVVTAAAATLPPGFQKVTEAGLRQARMQVSGATAYCLLVRFEADAAEARLSWLPGAASDAARCLAGALPAPREIPGMTPP
ncbi:MAG: hypothetical protein EOP35_13910 [Rubrivivax sp.]|nr:MAG: hypothetical protein EOP35_13910 [Rubrivivax sp.]